MPQMHQKGRSRSDQSKFYEHPVTGEKLIRVTAITSVPSNWALENWKVKQNRKQVEDGFLDAYRAVIGMLTSTKQPMPSVEGFQAIASQIIGDIRADEKKADAAADVGRLVHDYISETLLHEMGSSKVPSPLPDALMPGFLQWDAWRKEVGFVPEFVEDVVYNLKWKYAGRRDAKGKIKTGQTIIADWKTSGDLYGNYCWQVAAYEEADRESGHGGADLGVQVLIPVPKEKKTPKFKVVMRNKDEMAEDFTVFRACLHIYRWQERNA